jgi:hypothetical protein
MIEQTESTVDIVHETENALLVFDGDRQFWLPKSQIEYCGEPGDKAVTVTLPLWLAEKVGLI